jgi:hypothetical protein
MALKAAGWLGSALLLALSVTAWGGSEEPECRVERAPGGLRIRLQTPGLFRGRLEQLLDSGFELALGYSFELLGPQDHPLASATLDVQAAADLWNEDYAVQTRSSASSQKRVFRKRDEALAFLRHCELVLPVAGPAGPALRLRVRVRLEPASAETTQESRAWLKGDTTSGAEEDASGPNLFAAFVHLLATPDLDEAQEASFVFGPWGWAELGVAAPEEPRR